MANVKLTDINKSYGDVEVLHEINLEIQTGEFIVFVGPSGCGKSTLLRIIAGLEKISSGTLEIEGRVVNDIPPSQRGIAMVFQSYALYPHMTVYDNMAFGLRLSKATHAEIDERVQSAAAVLQLEQYLDRLPKALSGGQRQRVAIGRAICRDPKVFLFDEPLSNLDAALRVATRIEIAKLAGSMPETTMVYVTHDQVEAMTLADRIVVLRDGHVEQVGSPMTLYHKPANLFVAQFIGSPAMNILSGHIMSITEESIGIKLDAGGVTEVRVLQATTAATSSVISSTASSTASPATSSASSAASSAAASLATSESELVEIFTQQPVSVGIRPEDFRIASNATSAILSGIVDIVESLGEVTLLHVRLDDVEDAIVAKLPGDVNIDVASRIALEVANQAQHVFDSEGQALLHR